MSTVAPSRLTLRRMQLAEIAELAEVIPEISDAQLANRWREQSQGYRELLVAERNGELVGTVSIAETYRPPSLHLFALEVAASRRNEGIGGEIVAWVVDEARRRGLRRVYLEVRTDNPARRLYHRLGFRRVREFVVALQFGRLSNADGGDVVPDGEAGLDGDRQQRAPGSKVVQSASACFRNASTISLNSCGFSQ